MTSTSFNSPKPGRLEHLCSTQRTNFAVSEEGAASRGLPLPSRAYEVETRRMKAFAGQRKFQAPVSDDFSRGLLSAKQSPSENAEPKHTGLINSLTAWWRRQMQG